MGAPRKRKPTTSYRSSFLVLLFSLGLSLRLGRCHWLVPDWTATPVVGAAETSRRLERERGRYLPAETDPRGDSQEAGVKRTGRGKRIIRGSWRSLTGWSFETVNQVYDFSLFRNYCRLSRSWGCKGMVTTRIYFQNFRRIFKLKTEGFSQLRLCYLVTLAQCEGCSWHSHRGGV